MFLRFHEYFATSIKHGAIYGLEDLMSVKLINDGLKGFINKWDSVLAGTKKEPENNVLEAYFHSAIKHFKPLEHDLALYDRAAEGSKERSYDFLITAARAGFSSWLASSADSDVVGSSYSTCGFGNKSPATS